MAQLMHRKKTSLRKLGAVTSVGGMLRASLGCLVWSLCSPLALAEKTEQELVWMTMDMPPVLMIVDGRPTDGFVDAILKMIFAEMPEASHRLLVMPAARAWTHLSRGLPMCFVTPLRTQEREEIAFFAPTQLIPPIQLVGREDIISKLPRNAAGEVLADALINQSDLRGLITLQRGYTQSLDTILSRRAPHSGVQVVGASSHGNILRMISKGRADYTLEFDYILAYERERDTQLQLGPALKALPIADTRMQVAGVACPRTEWGRSMVMRVDAILARISQRPDYQAALNRWLSADTLKRYQKELSDFYRARALRTESSEYRLP